MLIPVQNDYSHAGGMLDRIKAAVTDIGWMVSQLTYRLQQPPEKRQWVNGTEGNNGRRFLEELLDDQKRKGWLQEINVRAQKHMDGTITFETLLRNLAQHIKYDEKAVTLEYKRLLCLRVGFICDSVEAGVIAEAGEKAKNIRQLLE